MLRDENTYANCTTLEDLLVPSTQKQTRMFVNESRSNGG
jgi:hypothetical protein